MSQTKTVIEINAISAKISKLQNDAIESEVSHLLFSSSNEASKKDELIAFLKTIEVSGDVYLIAGGQRNCLVPVSVFDASKPNQLFEFTFGEKSKDVDFCRLPNVSLVNIYEVPLWIKSFFVVKFPTLILLHHSTAMLKILSQFKGLNTRVSVQIHATYFTLSIYHLGNVVFQNTFTQVENSDVLYYTLHTMKQLNLAGRRANLLLTSESKNEVQKCKNLIEEMKKIGDFSQLQVEWKENFIAENIKLCE
jgi:hypothetical protein